MSTGDLCGKAVLYGLSINTANPEYAICRLYFGHDGPHECTIYHSEYKDGGKTIINHRIGKIIWDDSIANPEEKRKFKADEGR